MNEKHIVTLFFCVIIIICCFMIGFASGYACGRGQRSEKHLKEQKMLLFDQNKLLKENIELQKQIIKSKRDGLFE